MKKIIISAALATYNEEENIVDCIESLKNFAQEIVVVDGNSTDRTVELAEKFGAKVIKTTNKPMFHINKNLAIDGSQGKWIFLIDADERVSSKLAQEIKNTIAKNPQEDGFYVNRKNWFLGDFLKKGGAYPDSVLRLFKKGKGHLPEISVHEQVKVDGQVAKLNSDILHIADPNFRRYLMRANRYTTQTAIEIGKQNPEKSLSQLLYWTLIKPTTTFVKIYFRHRGYVDGFRGFIWAFFSSAHFFIAYVKYYARNQSQLKIN